MLAFYYSSDTQADSCDGDIHCEINILTKKKQLQEAIIQSQASFIDEYSQQFDDSYSASTEMLYANNHTDFDIGNPYIYGASMVAFVLNTGLSFVAPLTALYRNHKTYADGSQPVLLTAFCWSVMDFTGSGLFVAHVWLDEKESLSEKLINASTSVLIMMANAPVYTALIVYMILNRIRARNLR